MQVRGKGRVHLRPGGPGVGAAVHDAAVGVLEGGVVRVVGGVGGGGVLGVGLVQGVGFHPGHGRVGVYLRVPGAVVFAGGDGGGGHGCGLRGGFGWLGGF